MSAVDAAHASIGTSIIGICVDEAGSTIIAAMTNVASGMERLCRVGLSRDGGFHQDSSRVSSSLVIVDGESSMRIVTIAVTIFLELLFM